MKAAAKEILTNLRLSLALMLVMIAVGVTCVLLAKRDLEAEEQGLKATRAKVADIRNRLSKAREEEQEIRAKIARFADLQSRGVIGEEERLDWVEQIRRIKTERRLYDIQYEIAPQHVVSPAVLPGSSGSFEFYTSSMELRMELLHEEDLLNFLSDLRGAIHAYVRVSRCAVERQPRAPTDTRSGAQLKSECRLDLITARERKSS